MIGLGALTGGGVSASSSASTGPIRQALENAISQNNAVFVGGSGKSKQGSTQSPTSSGSNNSNTILIVGAIGLVAVIALLKSK